MTVANQLLPKAVRRVRRTGLLRQVGTPVFIEYRRLVASGRGPRILVNSIPKAGTHLLTSLLSTVRELSFSGVVSYHDKYATATREEGLIPDWDPAELRSELTRVRNGSFVNGHLYWTERTQSLLEDLNYVTLFMKRDPHDILVSNAHYIRAFKGHPRHQLMMTRYPSFDEQLMALITGYPELAGERGLANIGHRLDSFISWQEAVPTYRFEDFLSTASPEVSERTFHDLIDVLQTDDLRLDINTLRTGLNNRWSPTLRTGESGSWRQVFSKSHIDAFNHFAGEQTIRLGYALD